ncbi:hypothetical protein VTN77DRAFT_8101 [Rasamsonia byssochlamydoides]|uniref:uncharacterized protein n=1 Tax=Rasamsonia byssochlamydoides TaxID=89139 RepID=UPI003743DAE7
MPRPKKPGAPEPKRRSRKGCWPCKARKVKCGEEKPTCSNCLRQGGVCDYSIRLNWEGRTKRKPAAGPAMPSSSSGMVIVPSSFQQSQAPVVDSPTFPVTTPIACGTESARRLVQSPQDTQNSPITPASLFGNSPVSPGHAIERSYSNVSIPTKHSEQTLSPPTLPQDVSTPFEISHPQKSRVLSYPSPSDTNFLSSGIGPLSSLAFDNHSVSQPTSFLRQTFQAASEISTRSPVEDKEQPYRATRFKGSSYIFPSGVATGQDPNSSQAESPNTINGNPLNSVSQIQNLRRVPVNSLLSHAVLGEETPGYAADDKQQRHMGSESINFGLDCGRPDLDLNKNNDAEAIENITSPDEITRDSQSSPASEDAVLVGSQIPRRRSVFTPGAYYANPVPINIPRYLTPLPSTLQENPINLMYFHHFLNHTARILVPHDCEENPFISVLPSMAITDPNLLNLMLAYSASHRARFLRHPEPSNRIAHWVSDVFPALRHALHDPHENITDSHLATAIMLLSLKIVSPSTFEVPIPWQNHLKLARDLFLARGVQYVAHPGNKVAFFLARWFGYLDIFGSLSCRRGGPPLLEDSYWSPTPPGCIPNENDDYRVDCFCGFTPRTGIYLARLGRLTHRCDNERFDEVGNFLPDWAPSEDVVRAAEALLDDMRQSRQRGHASGTHHTEQENQEMIAIDLAFHWSAVLHVHRRVLGKPAFAPEVREAIDELCSALTKIRPGSSTEVSVLFPLFTAGCEIQDHRRRLEVMTRVMNFEAEGLKQIKNARKLMQRCWEENLPWIALAHGEFLG